MRTKAICISYEETLRLLCSYTGIDIKLNDPGLSSLLFLLIKSYFCNIDHTQANEEIELISLLQEYNLMDFESSGVGYEINNSIVNITNLFLSGFKSHDTNFCINKNDIQFINQSDILIHLTDEEYNLFTSKQPGFMYA